MRFKIWGFILGALALLCIFAAVFGPAPAISGLVTAAAFPFAQIGKLLRSLSLAGAGGNAAAVILYCGLALIPSALLLRRLIKKRACMEDALLAVMSALLFFMLYYLANPLLLDRIFPPLLSGYSGGLTSIGPSALGSVFYSLLIGYLVLRLLRRVNGRETGEMLSWLQRLLFLLSVFLVFKVFFLELTGLLSTLQELRNANTDPQVSLGLTTAFLSLRFGLELVPTFLSFGLLALAIKLAEALKQDQFGDETVAAATRLGRFCKSAIVATILSAIVINLAQLLLARWLVRTSFSAYAPLPLLIFTLALLALAQYFAQGNKLQRDNQLFV